MILDPSGVPYGAGLTIEQRLARLEQRLGAAIPTVNGAVDGSVPNVDSSLAGGVKWAQDSGARWERIIAASGYLPGGNAAASWISPASGLVLATSTCQSGLFFYIDPAEYALTGKTAEWRLVSSLISNATDPVTSGTLTTGMTRVTSMAGGANVLNLTGSVGVVAETWTAADCTANALLARTETFTLGTAGIHCFYMANSATTAANSVIHASYALEVRHA